MIDRFPYLDHSLLKERVIRSARACTRVKDRAIDMVLLETIKYPFQHLFIPTGTYSIISGNMCLTESEGRYDGVWMEVCQEMTTGIECFCGYHETTPASARDPTDAEMKVVNARLDEKGYNRYRLVDA